MFKKKNIIDFVYDVIKDEELEIIPIVKIVSMDYDVVGSNRISFSDSNPKLRLCQISLNKKYFYSFSKHFIKANILHEIGHAVVPCRSKVDGELYAHMWAIAKADKMNLKYVVKNLFMVLMTWESFEWSNPENRIYILAAKKFKKIFKIK